MITLLAAIMVLGLLAAFLGRKRRGDGSGLSTLARNSSPKQGTHKDAEILDTMTTWERCVIITRDSVIKREIPESDLPRRPNGKIIRPYWARERLQNEAATLKFVASHTTILVPDCRLFIEDGLLCLETTRITNGILLLEIEEASRSAAFKAVDEQINQNIIPQLRSLRRKEIGSVDNTIPVFPPQRVYNRDRRSWPRITSDTDDFVLCHNDLAPQNIFIDPNTFQIVGIIDWEYAGFFPQEFELPLWRVTGWEAGEEMCNEARPRELEFFGLEPADLQDCSVG